MAPGPLIHIGYHKTASTWLQRELFPNHEGIELVAGPGRTAEHLIRPHPLAFDASQARAALMPDVEAAYEAGKVPVLTNERLSGYPHLGGYDADRMARRIHAAFPEAKIWVAIREQVSAIHACYRQFVRAGGPWSLDDYLDPRDDGATPGFSEEHFRYLPLVELYHDLFGEDAVLVTLLEAFSDDPSAVIDRVEAHADIEPSPGTYDTDRRIHPSLSDPATRLLRLLNRRFSTPKLFHYPALGFPNRDLVRDAVMRLDLTVDLSRKKGALRRGVEAWCGDRFAASNRRLSQVIERDLGAWGYRVADG